MARRVSNNPSGKYLQMSDEQFAREQARFDRAVQRQREKDAARAGHRFRPCAKCGRAPDVHNSNRPDYIGHEYA